MMPPLVRARLRRLVRPAAHRLPAGGSPAVAPPALVAELQGLREHLNALDQRLDRMERHQARFVETVTAQTQRADFGLEDTARAIEALRRRLEAVEERAAR